MTGSDRWPIDQLCHDIRTGSMNYSRHYTRRLGQRPTPTRDEIEFLICEDKPQVIEDYPNDPRGNSCLIAGITDQIGRIGHIVCANPPISLIITAYFPAETEPENWGDDYRRRIPGE